jgi:hypothetical protein
VDPRSYIERIAQELARARGRGLVLSPADAQLALGWHAAGVGLEDVLDELRRAMPPARPFARRGATQVGFSLQVVQRSIAARQRRAVPTPVASARLSADLLRACRRDLPGNAWWHAVATQAESLLAGGPEKYWSELFSALRRTLTELPRARVRDLGLALRARMAPRPPGMDRKVYRKSLQLQLLSAASERLGVPPREFLF